MKPVVSIYSSFYQRCYDQVIHDVCLQNLGVVMCVDRAGLVGADGDTHQGLYDMAFMRSVPNLIIMCPRNYKELEDMLELALKLNKPVLLRYPRGEEIKDNYQVSKINLCKAELLENGSDLTIICIGKTCSTGIYLAEKLKDSNKSCTIINCRFLKPLDSTLIVNSLNKTKKAIVIEDSTIINGLSTSIKELIIDNKLNVKLKCYAYPDKFIEHGDIKSLEKKYNLDVDSIYKDIIKNKFMD